MLDPITNSLLENGGQTLSTFGKEIFETGFSIAVGIASAILGYFFVTRPGINRALRVEKSQAYMGLEVAAIDIFKYKADNAEAIEWHSKISEQRIAHKNFDIFEEKIDQYYYQCLNLFEIISRFRNQKIVDADIYGSWVAWFYEALEVEYFREKWRSEYRDNYAKELQSIFNEGCKLWDKDSNHAAKYAKWEKQCSERGCDNIIKFGEAYNKKGDVHPRRKDFYMLVASVVNCSVVANWYKEPKEVRRPFPNNLHFYVRTKFVDTWRNIYAWRHRIQWPLPPEKETKVTKVGDYFYRWNDPADVADAAAFAGLIIAQAPEYISHGEIQTGLSYDGETWVPNLAELYAEDFASPDDKNMLVVRDNDHKVRAFLILAQEKSSRRTYAVIEDMAVDPELRGKKIGTNLLEMAEAKARSFEAEWVFLESGLGNEHAHRFFKGAGFNTISHVFAKKNPL